MNSDNNSLHQPNSIQQKSIKFSKSLKPLILRAVVLFIAVVAGAGGYWLGTRTGQKSEIISQPAPIITPTTAGTTTPAPTVSLTTVPVMPTEIPALTANWKTYINTRWGLSFKYPETWFPQEVPELSQVGDAVDFYLNGDTPHPGGEWDPTNAMITVENQEHPDYDSQTDEQFISKARQTDGKRILNVDGKPAIRGDGYRGEWYYVIKLSNTRRLIFATGNEDGAKKLDDIVSTIKFTDE